MCIEISVFKKVEMITFNYHGEDPHMLCKLLHYLSLCSDEFLVK
jgi:hypothetical protein